MSDLNPTKPKQEFLLASVMDMQATIRALDFKANVLLVLLALPFTKIELITPALVDLWREPRPILGCIAPLLIGVCGLAWSLATWATLRCLINVTDPSKHVAKDPASSDAHVATGAFFGARLFSFSWLDALAGGSGLKTATTPNALLEKLPAEPGLAGELAFEHLKLAFILARKGKCTRIGLVCTAAWGVAGLGLWACWIAHRWFH